LVNNLFPIGNNEKKKCVFDENIPDRECEFVRGTPEAYGEDILDLLCHGHLLY